MAPFKSRILHLKEACQITGARWAVLARRRNGRWEIESAVKMRKAAVAALSGWLNRPPVVSWLTSALDEGRANSRPLPSTLDGGRAFAFPLEDASAAILVGAERLPVPMQKVWRLVSASVRTEAGGARLVAPLQPEVLLPDLQARAPYDMVRALSRVLEMFTQTSFFESGWLAVRRGDSLEVQAQWNYPALSGASISMDEGRVWRRLARRLEPILVYRGQPDWQLLPNPKTRGAIKQWAFFPLVIGQRMIGVVALARKKELEKPELLVMKSLAEQAAPAVEMIITFAEMADHLRRLAVLNDFALTVSSAQNLDQIARRVLALLARAFGTDLLSLYLVSNEPRRLREYHNRAGKFVSVTAELGGHPQADALAGGKILRVPDTRLAGYQPVHEGAASALLLPLKYRGQAIGLLALESMRPAAFTVYDEHLLVVITSHLAGLVEYSRLREEAEGRARNLGLIHEVVQEVIGLTDKQEVARITANLLAQYFAFELAAVLLADENHSLSIGGFGGTSAAVVERSVLAGGFPVRGGITARVFLTGESMLVNDVSRSDIFVPIRGWQAGSEMCVALRDGDQILGIIDVESSQKNAFTHNDLLALESLAGILASVVSSADQYQNLQSTVRQLRNTQAELKTRIEAQRSAESRLLQAAKLAAVGEMAAGVAHELNNPLTTVTGFAELVLEELPRNSVQRPDLELILREANRARDVVRRLLDFARQTESTRARADLNEVVEDVLALTRHLLHTSGIRLSTTLYPNLPWVSMDRNQMKQVLLNLFHNAIQAMPQGGFLDVTTALQIRENRQWATVSIRDSGQGIPPGVKERIFEPFFTTKADQGGTGLGLSVTYGIVTDHGGFMDVESEPGRGACFSVWLPL